MKPGVPVMTSAPLRPGREATALTQVEFTLLFIEFRRCVLLVREARQRNESSFV